MAHRLWHEKTALARGTKYGSLRVRSEAEGQWKGERHEEPPLHCSEASKAASGSSHAGEARELGTRCRWCWQLRSQRRSPSQLREARWVNAASCWAPSRSCVSHRRLWAWVGTRILYIATLALVRLRACDGTHLSMSYGCRQKQKRVQWWCVAASQQSLCQYTPPSFFLSASA